MTALLEIRGLTIDIARDEGPARVVDGIDLTVMAGESLGIVGESGCGKSLTMLSLVGLLPNRIRATAGSAMFGGKDLLKMTPGALRRVRGSEIGFIFQDPMTSLNPVIRIGDQIAEALIYQKGMTKPQAAIRAVELLALVGIPAPEDRAQAWPHELSGGMRQRVMIAMGLAGHPKLLIADEPTTALDVTIQAQIVDLVRDLKTRLNMSVVWITHDLALIAGLADRIAVLYAGTVVEDAPVAEIFDRPTHPYTRALLDSLPTLAGEAMSRLPSITGTPPEPGRRPPGCPFAPRCPLAQPACSDAVPKLAPVPGSDPRHRVACPIVIERAVA
ncbi:MAG: ABC transporter ATP-binding protein [Pseudotabrizicola sp.]|uniref:ABC transporter ATP-binding protein n=1 Tax=Pseudotabrizicola sp. TaxID=2939647 RepID=UPI00272F0CA9|nr:ABC transporter ATP-binding protein [Pseudotabrizicola sp.]MDP2082475.1 ABC transporter ATP-binding protein [Pseudotabrizicola sp.]MDZ7572781.1 ABC transporter ATP-binding protein [Pseudotabrizicola sp.]